MSAYYLRMLERLQHRSNLYSSGLEYLEYVPGGTQSRVVTVSTYDAVALTQTMLPSLLALATTLVAPSWVMSCTWLVGGRRDFTVTDSVYDGLSR